MTDSLYDQAVTMHSQGRIDDAMVLYQRIVQADPGHSDAIHLLGVALSQKGHFPMAVEFLKNAVVLNGDVPEYYINLGNALAGAGDQNLAEQSYARAVEMNAAIPEAWFGLGTARQSLGRQESAVEAYKKAIDLRPDFVEALVNLGGLLVSMGHLDDAVEAAAKAATLRPDEARPRYILAHALEEAGHPGEAAGLFATLTQLPQCAVSILFDAANRLANMGFHAEAAGLYQDALRKNPDEGVVWNNLANSLRELDRLEEARIAYGKALALMPADAPILSNMGTVLKDLGQWTQAESFLNRAIELGGGAKAHSNLGHVHYLQGDCEQAVRCFEQALACAPGDPDAEFHLGVANLRLGNWQDGWRRYESRWRRQTARERLRHQHKPAWDGGDLAGKTILIWSEQGLGDTLHFIRFVNDLAARGACVVVECQRSLVPLVGRMPAVSDVVAQGEAPPDFDVQAPLLSLPHLLGITLETLPPQAPYLEAPAERLSGVIRADKPKVGLVWAGESRRSDVECLLIDRRRSMALDTLTPVLSVKGIEFVSLQMGDAKSHLSAWPGITDASVHIRDFADTAALIGQLDGVVSVDTSVAHLAGSLGKPIWLLSRFDGCWRWLKGRSDSPWYPTMSVYAQTKQGDWETPVTALAQDMVRWVESR